MNRTDRPDHDTASFSTRLPLAVVALLASLALLVSLGCNDGGGNDTVASDLCIGSDETGDTDGDGVCDDLDECPADANKTEEGDCGCGVAEVDNNGNDISDCLESEDDCLNGMDDDADGLVDCDDSDCDDSDTDGDGALDCGPDADECPEDANKAEAGQCGCGNPDTDSDGDGTADCVELCDDDPDKLIPGDCGCGTPDVDNNGNDTSDCLEMETNCLDGVDDDADGLVDCDDPDCADSDTDGDGALDCGPDADECPEDADKQEEGQCGCGNPDTDSDGDGTADCNDECPADSGKTTPGQCGCGTPDTDNDGDGVANCDDNCVDDSNSDQTDTDMDGLGDACDPQDCSELFEGVDLNMSDTACWRSNAVNNPCNLAAGFNAWMFWDASGPAPVVTFSAFRDLAGTDAEVPTQFCTPNCNADPEIFTCEVEDANGITQTVTGDISSGILMMSLTVQCDPMDPSSTTTVEWDIFQERANESLCPQP